MGLREPREILIRFSLYRRMTPLNIVMKLVSCNGQPVANLSDSPCKTICDNETFLAYLRQVFRRSI